MPDPRPPLFNPFWMGPKFVPGVEITDQHRNWDQCARYLAEVLPPMLSQYHTSLQDQPGLTPALCQALTLQFQASWLAAFFKQTDSCDPNWPALEREEPSDDDDIPI